MKNSAIAYMVKIRDSFWDLRTFVFLGIPAYIYKTPHKNLEYPRYPNYYNTERTEIL